VNPGAASADWAQYGDWFDDIARTEEERQKADVIYDLRTGVITGHQACELVAQIEFNSCKKGHRTAAFTLAAACLLAGHAAAIAVCEGAVWRHYNNQQDKCELDMNIKKTRC